MPMKRTLIRYKTKPDRTQENQRLIESVFEELEAKSPDGVQYLVVRLDDGTFVHFVAVDTKDAASPIPGLEAFQLFQRHQGALHRAAAIRRRNHRGQLSNAW
jgi:hypothetical protein